jgi:hypothetical protein
MVNPKSGRPRGALIVSRSIKSPAMKGSGRGLGKRRRMPAPCERPAMHPTLSCYYDYGTASTITAATKMAHVSLPAPPPPPPLPRRPHHDDRRGRPRPPRGRRRPPRSQTRRRGRLPPQRAAASAVDRRATAAMSATTATEAGGATARRGGERRRGWQGSPCQRYGSNRVEKCRKRG